MPCTTIHLSIPRRRILAYFDPLRSSAHQCLGNWLENLGEQSGVSIQWCEPDATELVALHCVAAIVDRDYIDARIYAMFHRFCKEVNDGKPVVVDGREVYSSEDLVLITIDGRSDLPLPKLAITVSAHLEDQRSLSLIMDSLDCLTRDE